MTSKTKIAVVVVITTAILVLFVLPAFDVDPTAMRSARAAELLMLSMAWAASLFFAFRSQVTNYLQAASCCTPSTPDPLQMTCSLLC